MNSRSAVKPLPMSVEEISARGWDQVDVVFVSGDGYVDHPSFATALLGRWLEANGFRVAILAQPDWKSCDAWRKFGRPRLCFAVSSGNMDSMVNHYTANRKVRNVDAYTPGGKIGMRPDRAAAVYCQRAREAFPGVPVVLGGVEASLRRTAHYDYWSDKVRRSVLLDSKADILSFGMGEHSLLEIVRRLDAGESAAQLRDIPGTAYRLGASEFLVKNEAGENIVDPARLPENVVQLPSTEEVAAEKAKFAEMTKLICEEMNPFSGRPLFQQSGTEAVVVNPPAKPLSTEEMDAVYALPFTRREHPSYGDARIPALQTVRDSIQAVRGCYGGCSFCSIGAHEGKVTQCRSKESILAEAKRMAEDLHFTGTITDIGGPTANMYGTKCGNPEAQKACRRRSCLYPEICPNLETSHREYLDLLSEVRNVPGVRNVFIASGIRSDLAQAAPEYAEFMEKLVAHHVGGHLSVAPEHISPCVLAKMHKPEVAEFDRFVDDFDIETDRQGKDFYTVPYFIASHPGCRLEDMVELAEYLHQYGYRPQQVQDFYPTPFSVATCMYYTGLDPFTGEAVHSAHGDRERKMQRALMQYFKPENYFTVREALEKVGRTDLIGTDAECLIGPRVPQASGALQRADGSKGGYRQRSREENEAQEQRAFQRAAFQKGATGFGKPYRSREERGGRDSGRDFGRDFGRGAGRGFGRSFDREDRMERGFREERDGFRGGESRFSGREERADRAGRFADRFSDRYSRARRNDERDGGRGIGRDGGRFERNDFGRAEHGPKTDRFGRVDYRDSWKTAKRGAKPKFHPDSEVDIWSTENVLRENGLFGAEKPAERREERGGFRDERRNGRNGGRGEGGSRGGERRNTGRSEGGFRSGERRNTGRSGGGSRGGERRNTGRGEGGSRGGERRNGGRSGGSRGYRGN